MERPSRRWTARLVLPGLAACVVTGSVVGIAVTATGESPSVSASSSAAARLASPLSAPGKAHRARVDIDLERHGDRTQRISRAARRVTLVERPVPEAHRFGTVALKVRVEPAERSEHVTVLGSGTRIGVTKERRGAWAEIVHRGRAYWVAADYLVKKKPKPTPAARGSNGTSGGDGAGGTDHTGSSDRTAGPAESSGTVSSASCPAGSSIESGIVPAAVTVYRAVCARFPMITSYGGWRSDGEHVNGRAIDIMVSGDLGWQVAEWLRANASTFGLYDVIYAQRIWTQDRSAEGWRSMEDRGSSTANHYDHVHVAVY